MRKSAFIFLVEKKARLLVAAWCSIPARQYDEETLLTLWSTLAGVERAAARRLYPVLLGNEVIGQKEDGIRFVDPLVEQVLFAESVGAITGSHDAGSGHDGAG